jgi:hypothetical protein
MNRMKVVLKAVVASVLVLALSATALAGQPVEIRLKDGSRWRGDLNAQIVVTFMQQRIEVEMTGTLVKAADLYIVVSTNIAGEMKEQTIFRDDIVKVETAAAAPASSNSKSARSPKVKASTGDSPNVPVDANGNAMGTIVLPLEGFVGGPFRKEEIIEVGKKADEIGPGQIIVLLIDSNGGSALESQYIADEIFKIRERHRVVAWIKKAISAGCQTAMCCQEIYFMTEGTAGAVTTWNPGSGQSIKGEELEKSVEHLEEIAERSGYSPYIAKAMKTNKGVVSYDKDPETGEVTFYPDKRGEFLLSDENSNLSFTSSVALHCGFSKGTADTEEELAKLLNLPKWHEVTDYGRKIAKEWQDTYAKAETEIPLLMARMQYLGSGTGTQLEQQIRIVTEIIRWFDRCPNYMMYNFPYDKGTMERQLKELKKALADRKKNDR